MSDLTKLFDRANTAIQPDLDQLQAAMTGYKVKPDAVVTDAGYLIPQPDGTYMTGTEPVSPLERLATFFNIVAMKGGAHKLPVR